MTDWHSAVVFALLILFTVTALELFRFWIARSPARRTAMAAGLVLGLIFFAIAAGGAVSLFFAGKGFLNLAFFLAGAAGFGILCQIVMDFGRRVDMRRALAADL